MPNPPPLLGSLISAVFLTPRRRATARRRFLLLCGAFVAAAVAPAMRGDVSLPHVLSEGMVLQREQPVPIWGKADAGEEVAVRFAGQEKHAVTSADGRWQIALDPLTASAEGRELIVAGKNTLKIANVLVGEVWLCSGQSNMEMAVDKTTAGAAPATKSNPALAEELAAKEYPLIRLFRVEKKLEPPDAVSAGWQEAKGDARAMFSAAGYYFAREIHGKLSVPVGMLQAAWGGSRIEPWTPPEAYAALPAFAKETAVQPFQIDGMAPGKYYDGMVRPLAPFALRGVLWYQGESNVMTHDRLRYADKMQALIDGWRKEWKRADLPFFSVQLAPYLYTQRKDKVLHDEDELPKLWEAQARSVFIPNTGLVPIDDLVDDPKNIHPGKKDIVGQRLAALVLARIYHQGTEPAAPTFDRVEFRGKDALVHFRNAPGGLAARNNQPLEGFEVAGADGRFYPASAVIEGGDNVAVSCPNAAAPAAVRFAWRETAPSNLVAHESGWPAYPFRSDGPDWKPYPK